MASIYYSFTAYNIMLPPTFVGLSNFHQLLSHDPLFRQALLNTCIFTLFSVPLDLGVALLFAILLNRDIPGRAIFRTAFYFPAIVPSVATGTLWIMVLRTRGGLVNVVLGLFGIKEVPWLSSPEWAMPTLILVSLWTVGPAVIIFLAGLQDVPRPLYEAAQIDGANALSLVRHVTLPMLSPVILFNLILGMIGALQAFDLPFILFGSDSGRRAQLRAPVLGPAFQRGLRAVPDGLRGGHDLDLVRHHLRAVDHLVAPLQALRPLRMRLS